jgi:hypothetical protein
MISQRKTLVDIAMEQRRPSPAGGHDVGEPSDNDAVPPAD